MLVLALHKFVTYLLT